jgi:hypothetical protein
MRINLVHHVSQYFVKFTYILLTEQNYSLNHMFHFYGTAFSDPKKEKF